MRSEIQAEHSLAIPYAKPSAYFGPEAKYAFLKVI